MPRSSAIAIENSFVKGLVTEATGLNFPENACTETFNCVFQHTGEVSRRLGVDYEDGYVLNSVTSADNAVREFLWKAVALNGEFTFEVVQIGNVITFYAVETSAISAGLKSFTVNLNSYKASGAPSVNDITCSFASGSGYLFISHPYCDPIYVSYNSATNTITTTTIPVKVRDFEGLDDTLDDDTRPATLTKEHHYNLLNQGWSAVASLTSDGKAWTQGSPLQYWRTAATNARTDFPSNADTYWSYKTIMRPVLDATGNVVTLTPVEAFSMIEAQNVDKTGNSKSPRGHYIFSAWSMDRAAVSYPSDDTQTALTGIPVVTSGYQRPAQVAFYASRVWYAGTNANGFNNKIYFSKIIERVGDFGKCYQLNDPTTENASDLLPSDGGYVLIQEISKVNRMQQKGSALFIYATNGVWKIEGSSGIGFAADNYSVTKVSPIGSLSDLSFVDVEGQPMWWNTDGIWTVQTNQGGIDEVVSLSFGTIQTFLDDNVSPVNKRYVKGIYNPLEKIVQWLYRTTDANSIDQRYQYDGILNLSLVTQSFYPWSIPNTGNKIIGICTVLAVGQSNNPQNVTDNSDVIVTTGAGNVTISGLVVFDLSTVFKYLVLKDSTHLTFGEFTDDDYVDWFTSGEAADFTSYFITGFKVHGNAIKKFQSNYTQIFTRNDIPSVFDFQSRWDFALSGDTGRWSNVQRVTMDDTNYQFRTKRLKIRGHGKVLQYKVNSVTGQPLNMIGWSSLETANASP